MFRAGLTIRAACTEFTSLLRVWSINLITDCLCLARGGSAGRCSSSLNSDMYLFDRGNWEWSSLQINTLSWWRSLFLSLCFFCHGFFFFYDTLRLKWSRRLVLYLLWCCHVSLYNVLWWQGSPGEAGMPGLKGSKVSRPVLFPLKAVLMTLCSS